MAWPSGTASPKSYRRLGQQPLGAWWMLAVAVFTGLLAGGLALAVALAPIPSSNKLAGMVATMLIVAGVVAHGVRTGQTGLYVGGTTVRVVTWHHAVELPFDDIATVEVRPTADVAGWPRPLVLADAAQRQRWRTLCLRLVDGRLLSTTVDDREGEEPLVQLRAELIALLPVRRLGRRAGG